MFTSLGTALLVISILFPFISTCAVGLRLRARAITKVPLGIDDWTIILGLIFAYMDNFTVAYSVYNAGFGIPQNEIGGQLEIEFGKSIFTETLCWQAATATIKTSILLFYRRIFITKRFHRAVYILISITLAWLIGNIFATVFAWSPVDAEWTRKGHTNINYPAFLISTGVLTIVLDLVTLSYPLFVIRRLHITTRKKVVISAIFLLGLLCVIASVIRLPYRVMYLQAVANLRGGEADAFTLDLVPKILLWGLIEVDLAVIAACLPTFAPLLHDRALESVIRSARSAISLRSRRSRESGDSSRQRQSEPPDHREAKRAWMATQGSIEVSVDGSPAGISAGEELDSIRRDQYFTVVAEGDQELSGSAGKASD